MTDLTDKWKKGELPEDFYYAKCPWCDEVDIRYIHNGVDDYEDIIMPVPSYDEWKKAYEFFITETNEKTLLKELLKECRDEIDYLRKHYKGNIDHFKNNTRLDKEINQALGEE